MFEMRSPCISSGVRYPIPKLRGSYEFLFSQSLSRWRPARTCIARPKGASTKMLNTGETQNAKYCGRINPSANVIFSTLAYKTVSQQFNRE
jgi:hypothetical protein